MKMKRKDLDQFNDEFSDFSLSSPARKIRRLDAGLPPIIEEEEEHPEISVFHGQPLMPANFTGGGGGVRIEELSDDSSALNSFVEDRPYCDNEEKAIVLFKPVNSSFLQQPSLSVSVDSDIISGIKSGLFRENQSNVRLKLAEEEDEMGTENNAARYGNLAVVPWFPRPQIPAATNMYLPQAEAPELMEADDIEGATMDMEEDGMISQQPYGYSGIGGGEAVHQWHHQHCMVPQPPHQTSTPISWFR